MMPWIALHKLADVIFGITQNLLYITSSNLPGNISLIKGFFWTCYVTWSATGH